MRDISSIARELHKIILRVEPDPNRRPVVFFEGASGAGKSTLIRALVSGIFQDWVPYKTWIKVRPLPPREVMDVSLGPLFLLDAARQGMTHRGVFSDRSFLTEMVYDDLHLPDLESALKDPPPRVRLFFDLVREVPCIHVIITGDPDVMAQTGREDVRDISRRQDRYRYLSWELLKRGKPVWFLDRGSYNLLEVSS